MITDQFIEELNKTINDDGRKLITNFFIIFSRFECALKSSNFKQMDEKNNKVSANWEQFISSIKSDFNKNKCDSLKEAVTYIIENPPKMQVFEDELLGWKDRRFQQNCHEINKLDISIRDIRNNLFHGGKFNGNYQKDVTRNIDLIKSAIIILNEWLSLDESVKNNFLQPIE
ncbi:hypothetical protein SAMN04515674_103195 [Pseudarcicella hirudinis]|uniref:Uncharacterized protein n=1 Tax=Pseudarcicella hirudinis TaxID=1079859 RepID=A0A1I5QHE5_9BACT|nr:hypothetical protein [Pseudarcicella hirudinis]SFP45527.1 hypothetical protein SAMN04515674_103195 [Pseudarcicella hirudinis]